MTLRIEISAAVFLTGVCLFLCPSLSAAESPSAPAEKPRLSRAAEPFYLKEDQISIRFGAESRYRFEWRDDFNLNDPTYEDDGVSLFRNRIHTDIMFQPEKGGSALRLFAEGQDSRSIAQSGLQKTAAFLNSMDLRQLFFEADKPFKNIPVKIKVGRQELAYGDERFVGAFGWSNVARVFDAVKTVFLLSEGFQLDVFFARPVRVEKFKADRSVSSDNFYGVYGAWKFLAEHILDTFLFVRHNRDEGVRGERLGEFGPLKEYTFGNRFKGKKSGFDYGTEYAIQLGSRSHDSIAAWAFHAQAGYTFEKTPWMPRLGVEFNHASGDKNPTDGKSGTFDNLFPTNHDKYGLIDFLSLKNMNDIKLGASVKPHARLAFASDFHWFFLDAKESAWFKADGTVFRAANAGASVHLGEEIDLYASYKVSEFVSAVVGYSCFFAGPFAGDTGADDHANFFYAQLVWKI